MDKFNCNTHYIGECSFKGSICVEKQKENSGMYNVDCELKPGPIS